MTFSTSVDNPGNVQKVELRFQDVGVVEAMTEAVEQRGVPFLGMIPAVQRGKEAVNPLLTDVGNASFAEAFKTVRTNVLFSSADDGLRTLVVTSAGPGEGKSICSANIAVALAQTGLRVLLVDADMRLVPALNAIPGVHCVNPEGAFYAFPDLGAFIGRHNGEGQPIKDDVALCDWLVEHARVAVVPGSGLVKAQAEREGLHEVFKAAGFEWREPGCSMCLAMNADRLEPGERCASTSNRNFEGRQGAGGRTHLVSPAMAAAAAIEGHFVDVRRIA